MTEGEQIIMVPFRVHDRENKESWLVLNFQPTSTGGNYLASKEDVSRDDGQLRIISAKEMENFYFVGFYEKEAE